METKEIKDRLAKLIAERDKQSEKVARLSAGVETARARLARENAKLTRLNEQIDRFQFFIFKDRLKSVGVDGEDGIEELLSVYERHKDEIKGDED
jgi:predicted nuclease with TOPRIM domain